MKQFGILNDYMKILKNFFKVSFSIVAMVIPLTAFSYFMDKSLLRVPLVLYASLYFTLSVGSAASYNYGVYKRLESVNEVLLTKLNQPGIIHVKTTNQTEETEVFVGLSQIYSILMNVCDDINLCFGFQMMLGFGIVFFYTLFTTFTAYTDFVSEGTLSSTTISSIAFCIFFNVFLTLVIFTCNILDKEVWY
jgi:7tm Chemosensory receptor